MRLADQVLVRVRCRSCGGTLEEVLNLGPLYLNAFPVSQAEIDTIPRVPLILMVCGECGLVQLGHTVPPDWLYRQYWYRSGVNEMMVSELEEIVFEAGQRVGIGPKDRVLDIGANDGTLLSHYLKIYTSRCPIRVAYEPALNLHTQLHRHCDELVPNYFPRALQGDPYKIITAIACAYDVEDPVAFFEGIRAQLHPDGLAIVQFQDFGQQLTASAFDTICHEHLEYYTLWSLLHIVNRVGLEIADCRPTPINGGSLRVTLTHRNFRPAGGQDRVLAQLTHEMRLGLDTPAIRQGTRAPFAAFAGNVAEMRRQIAAVLEATLDITGVIDVYGASTKGNILLQVLGLTDAEIRQAIDRSPEKRGRYTITGIPIVGEEAARREPADLWLCPIWQFRESVLTRERWYLDQGGTILFPLPQVELVRTSWKAPDA